MNTFNFYKKTTNKIRSNSINYNNNYNDNESENYEQYVDIEKNNYEMNKNNCDFNIFDYIDEYLFCSVTGIEQNKNCDKRKKRKCDTNEKKTICKKQK
jgi:hypothetical protein